MPAKNHTRHPQHVIDAAVKRYLDGESVAVLAKYYGMSKAGVYLWIDKYKKAPLEEKARANMPPQVMEAANACDSQALQAQVVMWKSRCCELMAKHGDFRFLSDR